MKYLWRYIDKEENENEKEGVETRRRSRESEKLLAEQETSKKSKKAKLE